MSSKKKKPNINNKLGYRIEGHCTICRWEFYNVQKECPNCYGVKLITYYTITSIEDNIHEEIIDPDYIPPPSKRFSYSRKRRP